MSCVGWVSDPGMRRCRGPLSVGHVAPGRDVHPVGGRRPRHGYRNSAPQSWCTPRVGTSSASPFSHISPSSSPSSLSTLILFFSILLSCSLLLSYPLSFPVCSLPYSFMVTRVMVSPPPSSVSGLRHYCIVRVSVYLPALNLHLRGRRRTCDRCGGGRRHNLRLQALVCQRTGGRLLLEVELVGHEGTDG